MSLENTGEACLLHPRDRSSLSRATLNRCHDLQSLHLPFNLCPLKALGLFYLLVQLKYSSHDALPLQVLIPIIVMAGASVLLLKGVDSD